MILAIKIGDAFEFHFVGRGVIWMIALIFIQNVSPIEINYISIKYYHNRQCSVVHLQAGNLAHLHFIWNHVAGACFWNIPDKTVCVWFTDASGRHWTRSNCKWLLSPIHTFDGQMLRQALQLLMHTSPKDALGTKHK